MRRTILIVEEAPEEQARLQALFAPAGFEVVLAGSAAEAIELATRTRPVMVFLAQQLTDMDGYELCRRLRAHRVSASIPILMLCDGQDRATQIWTALRGSTPQPAQGPPG
jgi:DNA-binding response OmpR family regulator